VRPGPNLTDGGPAPCPTPDGSNAFLVHFLSAALLDSGWSVSGGSFSGAKSDWVGTTLMDPSEPFFEDLLLEQLERRMSPAFVPSAQVGRVVRSGHSPRATLPSSRLQGIAVDRFDYTAYYSYKRDDGISWVPQQEGGGSAWGPAQSLVVSHVHTYARMAAALRAASPTKVMFGNCNTLCRIDVAGPFDGGFSEGAALNAVAWLGLAGRPTILWTYDLSASNQAELDAYFQQHALMRVFPMAPMPGNDHSILPGPPLVQRAYEDYAPIFRELRGALWVLDAARPVTTAPSAGGGNLVNVFRSLGAPDTPAPPGRILVVVALGGGGPGNSTAVTLTGATLFQPGIQSVEASVLLPGAGQSWLQLGRFPWVASSTVTVPAVPLQRGFALLQLLPA
jgi:hypothetical protein